MNAYTVSRLGECADEELFIALLTLAEPRRGILEKSPGMKRESLKRWFSGPEGPQALFRGRILPFDDKAAIRWAELMADGKVRGRSRSALNIIIAAVAIVNSCIEVTDNERDVDGGVIVKPIGGLLPRLLRVETMRVLEQFDCSASTGAKLPPSSLVRPRGMCRAQQIDLQR